MGVRIEMDCQLKLNKTLSLTVIKQMNDFSETRHDSNDFPSIWCGWMPTEDGNGLEWNSESESESKKWLEFVIKTFLEPNGYVLNGVVLYECPEYMEIGTYHVVDNKVHEIEGQHVTLETLEHLKSGEIFIDTNAKGEKLVFQSFEANPAGTDYVRIVNSKGTELAYWDSNEWKEDPKGVMGAILGAMVQGAEKAKRG